MEANFFIKPNYTPNKVIETVDTENKKYWTNVRIKRICYTRYHLFLNIRKLIKKQRLTSVIDIGCGPATKLMKLLYPICREVYGIDQKNIIKRNIKKFGLTTFYCDDLEKSTLDLNKKFDLIICTDVIEHLSDPDKLLEYIKKFCHENTYIFFTTTERDIIRGKKCKYSPNKAHIREWNKLEFKKYLTYKGFKVIFQDVIENYKITYNIKNFFRYKGMYELYHNQLAICNLRNSKENIDKSINKIFGTGIKYYIRKLLNLWLLKFNSILFRIYHFGKKIGWQNNFILKALEKITKNL